MTIIRRCILLVLILYLVMSLSGYFATLNNTPEVVLLRTPPIPDWSTDWLMNIASILVMTTMVTNIVLNYMPFRNSLYYMFTGRDNFSQKFNLIATASFQAATTSVSIVFPNVSNVLAIFGGIASVNIVYIVPCKYLPQIPADLNSHLSDFSDDLHQVEARRRLPDLAEEPGRHHLLRAHVLDRLVELGRHHPHDDWQRG